MQKILGAVRVQILLKIPYKYFSASDCSFSHKSKRRLKNPRTKKISLSWSYDGVLIEIICYYFFALILSHLYMQLFPNSLYSYQKLYFVMFLFSYWKVACFIFHTTKNAINFAKIKPINVVDTLYMSICLYIYIYITYISHVYIIYIICIYHCIYVV